jgi:hypothetical protein
LLNYPVHVTGWLSHSLATAALLRAVGVGSALAAAAPAAAPALTAAAKWVLKDGLGAAGRLAVAGRVAGLLDSAPRQWRLYAELAALAGGALEVSTCLAPESAFLALAACGTALRAAAGSVAKPAHTVILAHLATPGLASLGARRASNLGAVAAKEEVQEVAANLSGLALSLLTLQTVGGGGSGEAPAAALVGGWAAVSAVHIALRYLALRGLIFRSLNARRAVAAAQAHVAWCASAAASVSSSAAVAAAAPPGDGEQRAQHEAWASFAAVNAAEPALIPWWAMTCRTHLGACVDEVDARDAAHTLRLSCASLAGERFRLAWRLRPDGGGGGDVWVFFTVGATPRDALRAAWYAARLFAAAAEQRGGDVDGPLLLARACDGVCLHFDVFERALRAESWDVSPLRDLPRARLHTVAGLEARCGMPAPAQQETAR